MVKASTKQTDKADLWGDDFPAGQGEAVANETPAAPSSGEGAGLLAADIVDPFSGEIIDPQDTDALIDCLERVKKASDGLRTTEMLVREKLVAMTEGDAKTRRVAGRRRKVVIEMPDDSWDQSILKEAFNSFPQHRDGYLRIEKLAPKIREYKKLVNTSGPDDLMTFRGMLEKANRGQTGTPSVKIEV